ncbi:L-aspartate oxidase [Shouchella sp. JSM 1781072]|uniref:L-aspartate oxidase n=1 Tax=Shouchella sp. JSM 1781072 TaxID=3344581 RepID=UPI0035BF2E8C
MKTVIIIGSGIAGLMAAHHLADECNVIIFTKSNYRDSNSARAQGGIAAAVASHDYPRSHFEDTMQAGKGVNDEALVEMVTKEAADFIHELENAGVAFEKINGEYALGQEGAHQHHRILFANNDQTGNAIVTALWNQVKNRVNVYEHTNVTALSVNGKEVTGVQTPYGVWAADAVVLATGGIGQLYAFNSNAPTATGEGMYLAYCAGAVLKDMEYIQFHPTILKSARAVLISEAVRGEGGQLINSQGERVLRHYPKMDLEGRDVVAAVLHKALRNGEQIYLDVRKLKTFSERFPFIDRACKEEGFDPMKDPLPVMPGAHFVCGGVEVDKHGKTAVERLYAIGEVACTGIHGSNRLASNSLLEAVYFAKKCATDILSNVEQKEHGYDLEQQPSQAHALPSRQELQQRMMSHVGIERTAKSLVEMKTWLESYRQFPTLQSVPLEDKAMFELASIITYAAIEREESRGTHRRKDFPNESVKWRNQAITFQRGIMSVCKRGG